MKVLVFEWLVGGGIAGDTAMPSNDPFLVQGADMYGAILKDCFNLGLDVLSPVDPHRVQAIADFESLRRNENYHITPIDRAQNLEPTLQTLAREADHIVLIAPECEGILLQCLDWLDSFQSKLVCGPANLIEIFADKNATQERLKCAGVPVPIGAVLPRELSDGLDENALEELLSKNQGLSWPLVVKPSDGAGGDNVLICHDLAQLNLAISKLRRSCDSLRVERYIVGTPVSVSIVRNEGQTRLLPATEQRFSNTENPRPKGLKNESLQPIGHFVKSIYPLEESLQRRAASLAEAVAHTFPQWRGYLGVDMVLAEDGADVVIELNPRLTASWCTLQAETGFNLMQFLLPLHKTDS